MIVCLSCYQTQAQHHTSLVTATDCHVQVEYVFTPRVSVVLMCSHGASLKLDSCTVAAAPSRWWGTSLHDQAQAWASNKEPMHLLLSQADGKYDGPQTHACISLTDCHLSLQPPPEAPQDCCVLATCRVDGSGQMAAQRTTFTGAPSVSAAASGLCVNLSLRLCG